MSNRSIHAMVVLAAAACGSVISTGCSDDTAAPLEMKTWVWIGALYGDERETVPRQSGVFTLTFGTDGKFSATTDCNRIGGSYAASDDGLTFRDIFATRMYCEGSQEAEFTDLLRRTASYRFDSRGQLVLSLELDSGTVTFR